MWGYFYVLVGAVRRNPSEPKGLGSIPFIPHFVTLFYEALLQQVGIWYWLFLGIFKKVK